MPRSYIPHKDKHKAPKGYGSLCPTGMGEVVAELCDAAVHVEGVKEHKLWVARGRWLFCLHPWSHPPDAWHGFPVIGGEADERVLYELHARWIITRRELRALRVQRALPEAWP